MHTHNQISLTRKALYGIMLLGVFLSAFGGRNLPSARAQEATDTPAPEVTDTPTPVATETLIDPATLDLSVAGASTAVSVITGDNNYFLQVDLQDPGVNIRVGLANNDNGGLQSLSGMATRYSGKGYLEWAVINGDLFSSGCPSGVNCAQGLTYIDGNHISNWSEYGTTWPVRGNIGFDSSKGVQIAVGDGQTKRNMTIAGGPWIVTNGGTPTCSAEYINGKTYFSTGEQFDGDARYWCTDTRAITLVGYSSDHRYLYLGVSSGGKTVTQLAQWLKDRGAYEILRLDSGGSSGIIHDGSLVAGSSTRSIANHLAIIVQNSPPPPPTGNWTANYYDTVDRWWDTNNSGNYKCSETINGPTLDKNYGSSAPCGGMDGDTWVGDYTAKINFPSGNYVFRVEHDDGLKLWVNNQNIADRSSSGADWMCPARSLSGDTNLRVMLREDGGDAKVKVSWSTDTSVCVTDGATFITQSAYPTVNPGQSFQIFFEVKNTGTSTWQPGSYWLQNLQYPLGANSQQSLSQSVPPNGTYRWTINQTAPSNLGTYRSQWMISHNGTTFGPNMYIDVTVQCVPSSVPPKPTLVFPPNGGSVNTLTPTLDWTDVSSNYCVDYYNFQVYEDGGGQIVMEWPGNSEYTIPSGKMAWGKKYSWYVWAHNALGFGDGFGASFEVVSPPPNDDFNTPKIISTMPYSDSLDTREATQASDDPALTDCNRAPGDATVWYQFIPPSGGYYYINTIGSDYDTMLAIWTGTRGNLNLIACNDDRPSDLQSELIINVSSGVVYYIEIAKYAGSLATSLSAQSEDKPNVAGDVSALSGGTLNFHISESYQIYLPLIMR